MRTDQRLPGAVCLSVALTTLLAWAVPSARAGSDDVIFVRAAELHVGNGDVVAGGAILVRDGRIADVGAGLSAPDNATVIELTTGSITPGLIDANAMIEPTDMMTPVRHGVRDQHAQVRTARESLHTFFSPRHRHETFTGCCGSTCSRALQHVDGKACQECGFPNAGPSLAVGTRPRVSLAEQSSEVIPHTRVIDSVNLRSPDFDRLLGGGVTTVFVSPDPAAVISSQGAVVRTGGPIHTRILRPTGAVKATIGTQPSRRGVRNGVPFRQNVDFHARRPTTRMGLAWVFRKAFYDTQRRRDGLAVYGADTPTEPALAILDEVLKGSIRLRVQARTQHDILSAHRLTEEFGLPFILEEATEAHRCLETIRLRETPVVFGPIYSRAMGDRAGTGEVSGARLHTLEALFNAGIETALTANDLRDQDGLARQAMYALRYGATLAQVTRAVTETPARLLSVHDQLGTLEEGKRADVVLWSGRPFEATSRPVVVLIDGKVVLDRRQG